MASKKIPSDVNITLSEADYYALISISEYSRPPANKNFEKIKHGTIKFPLPAQLPADHYSARLQNEDLGFVGAAIETASSPDFGDTVAAASIAGAGAVGGLFGALKATLTRNKPENSRDRRETDNGPSKAESIIAGTAVGVKAAETAVNNRFTGAYGGIVKNPRTALLFQGMNLRSFTFTFRLTPRSPDESKRYWNALNTMKIFMHPSFNRVFNSYVLDYPALFSCGFFSPSGLIFGAPLINNAFLADLKIDSSQTNNNFFKDGVPPVIDVSITLDEIEAFTQERLLNDFNKRSMSEYLDTVPGEVSDSVSNAWNKLTGSGD